jgi:calcium-dependent protein kinase
MRSSNSILNKDLNIVNPDELFFSMKTKNYKEDYEILKPLGEGAFGQVHLVRHKRNGEVLAMKSMKKSEVIHESKMDSLFAEVAILKSLDHPHIVKLYELYQDSKYYYMVTEYCSGGELFERI